MTIEVIQCILDLGALTRSDDSLCLCTELGLSQDSTVNKNAAGAIINLLTPQKVSYEAGLHDLQSKESGKADAEIVACESIIIDACNVIDTPCEAVEKLDPADGCALTEADLCSVYEIEVIEKQVEESRVKANCLNVTTKTLVISEGSLVTIVISVKGTLANAISTPLSECHEQATDVHTEGTVQVDVNGYDSKYTGLAVLPPALCADIVADKSSEVNGLDEVKVSEGKVVAVNVCSVHESPENKPVNDLCRVVSEVKGVKKQCLSRVLIGIKNVVHLDRKHADESAVLPAANITLEKISNVSVDYGNGVLLTKGIHEELYVTTNKSVDSGTNTKDAIDKSEVDGAVVPTKLRDIASVDAQVGTDCANGRTTCRHSIAKWTKVERLLLPDGDSPPAR